MFANPDSAVQSIVITSEAPGGKSTIAANLAVAYAQAGYKTLIVDRGYACKPTQHYILICQTMKAYQVYC